MLRSFEIENRELPRNSPFHSFISAAPWAICSTYHMTLQATPGQLVFGRDMLLSLPYRADWARIQERKQMLINKGVMHENANRLPHTYKVHGLVLLTKPSKLAKSVQPRTGLHTFTKVFKNGTVQLQCGAIIETLNIPYGG